MESERRWRYLLNQNSTSYSKVNFALDNAENGLSISCFTLISAILVQEKYFLKSQLILT